MSDRPVLDDEVEIPQQTAAIEFFAEKLYSKMEHLDPTNNPDWEGLPDRNKEYYRLCVEHLMLYQDEIRAALREG